MSENVEIQLQTSRQDNGRVVISPEVIEVITSLAAQEVEGVAHLRGSFASGVAERLGRRSSGKGIKVDMQEEEAVIDVYITAAYGKSIPDTARQIQKNIVETLDTMTAIKTREVNVHVTGVELPEALENPKE
ncbi:Asp23/Gls24 family envelope stress response protein [Alkalicoccus urumqiensis]|uniref:Asp23/Gls24 family envelope stress response protein n=1 Tax=Alkalicoccus urumqiensis TaxID=1548213 RepID=A0A2P6MKB3_ALKUR|nr:Asp23/Gls24 family envelope stress response protein [Alkalicoccus urumqiensis]PRO66708.1 Asp23/Gls24 family envelope stress response protein [Alkalicoccus urumqiensis]